MTGWKARKDITERKARAFMTGWEARAGMTRWKARACMTGWKVWAGMTGWKLVWLWQDEKLGQVWQDDKSGKVWHDEKLCVNERMRHCGLWDRMISYTADSERWIGERHERITTGIEWWWRGSDIRCRQERFGWGGGGHNEMVGEFLIRKFSFSLNISL